MICECTYIIIIIIIVIVINTTIKLIKPQRKNNFTLRFIRWEKSYRNPVVA